MKEIKALDMSAKAFANIASQHRNGGEPSTAKKEEEPSTEQETPPKQIETSDAPKTSDVFKKRRK